MGNKMEVATKSKGLSVEEYCDTRMGKTVEDAKLDEPFSTFESGEADKEFVEKDGNKGGKSRGGKGKGEGGGGKPTAAAASPVKSAYFDMCNHYTDSHTSPIPLRPICTKCTT